MKLEVIVLGRGIFLREHISRKENGGTKVITDDFIE